MLGQSRMRLPGRSFCSGFCCSIILVLYLPVSRLSPWWVALVVTALLALWTYLACTGGKWDGLSSCGTATGRVLSGLISGFIWVSSAVLIMQEQQFEGDTRVEALVSGRITGIPHTDTLRVRFDMLADPGTLCALDQMPCRVRVSWYRPYPEILPGQRWSLMLRVKAARGLANPGGFDYERWLFAKGIHATAYVRNSKLNALQQANNALPDWRGKVSRVRLNVAERIASLSQHPLSALVVALTVGIREQVPEHTYDTLRQTGTAHLLAISGMHVAMLAAACFAMGKLLWNAVLSLLDHWRWSRFSRIKTAALLQLQSANSEHFCSAVAVTGAAFYAVLAGFTLPTQRALIMVLLYFLIRLQRQFVPPALPLLVALAFVLVLDPFAPLLPGLWLSFGAVAGLMWLGGGRVGRSPMYRSDSVAYPDCRFGSTLYSAMATRLGQYVRQPVRLQIGLSVLLLPATLALFDQASLISPLANLLAIPVIAFAVLPLSLLALVCLYTVPVMAGLLLAASVSLLEALMGYLDWLAESPIASVSTAGPGMVALGLALLASVLSVKPAGGGLRWLCIPLAIPLTFPLLVPALPGSLPALIAGPSYRQNGFRVHVLDVGQGLSVIVETARHSLVYDTGPKIGRHLTSAEAAVVPFLQTLDISAPDLLVISHSDSDHASGAAYLQRLWPALAVISSHEQLEKMKQKTSEYPARPCVAGMRWQWDGVDFEILQPLDSGFAAFGDNDGSCVLLISTGRTRVLLPGDIEAKAEQVLLYDSALLERLKRAPGLDSGSGDVNSGLELLVAPHHGSDTSSSAALVEQLRPASVVYSVGAGNRFGFPHEAVQMRYKLWGTNAYRTDFDGALRFSFDESGLILPVEGFRHRHRRLWRVSPERAGLSAAGR